MRRISAEDARRQLRGYGHCSAPHQVDYLNKSMDRLVVTLGLMPELGPESTVLELGASPYFMTALLLHYFPSKLELANEPYWLQVDGGHVYMLNRELKLEHNFDYKAFNIETDSFPYEDGSVDAVLYCEMIEHLMHDPTHSLYEIHRVLKPGGHLILSTPNPFRWENSVKFITGRNIYPPFSGWGPYARHNREFSADELKLLLKACNFEMEELVTVYDPAYHHPRGLDRPARALGRLGWPQKLMDVIHLRARAVGRPAYRYPPELYLDVHAYQRIVNDNVEMGINDEAQLGEGFYKLENWPPHVRWTEKSARAKLMAGGHTSIGIRFFSGPKQLARQVSGSVAVNGTGHSFQVEPGKWVDLRFPLLQETSGPVDVELKVDRPWVPHETLGNPDTRQLGIAVQRIWLE